MDQHNRKKMEYEEWLNVARGYLDDKDAEARKLIVEFEKAKKHTARVVADNPLLADNNILSLKVRAFAAGTGVEELGCLRGGPVTVRGARDSRPRHGLHCCSGTQVYAREGRRYKPGRPQPYRVLCTVQLNP